MPIANSGAAYRRRRVAMQVLPASGTTTALEVGAADLGIPHSDLTLNGRMDLGNHDATIGALNGTGLIFANDLTRTLTLGANGHSGAFSGTIQNSASAGGITLNVVKTGAGTQSFAGSNTFSGVTALLGGTLVAASANALGSAAGGTIVANGATLALSNNIIIGLEPLTLGGTGTGESGALRNDYGLNSFNGAVTLSGATTIRAARQPRARYRVDACRCSCPGSPVLRIEAYCGAWDGS